jgi:hypothetical protein
LHDGQELPEVIAVTFTNVVDTVSIETSKVPDLASFCKQARHGFQRDFHRLFTGKIAFPPRKRHENSSEISSQSGLLEIGGVR